MGAKSSIDKLPSEIKAYIQAMLASGSMTLREMLDDLKSRYPAEAESLPSRTALHRYGQRLDRRLSAIRASTEAAKLISSQAGDDKDARSEALTALVQTELFEAILNLQEADDPDLDVAERVGMLSSAAKNIATLTRSSVNLKQFQAKVEADTRKRIMDEQRAKLEALGSKGGVTEETKAAIREALGIV